jgi:hypothetical protein
MILRALLTAVMMCFFAGTVQAQFVIENAKVVLAVSGGERVDDAVTIHNPSKEDVNVRVYWEDFEYIAPYDGSKRFLPAGTMAGSASQWVSFTPQEFKIPAFGKQKIDFTVTVPEGMRGGHYGVLFFEKVDNGVLTSTGVKVVFRTGALFFIEAKDKTKKADFQDIRGVDGKKIAANFVNQGDVVLIPRTTYYIMDADAYIVDRGDVPALYVPVGTSAPVEVALPANLKAGTYTFVINADLEEGDVAVNEIGFVKDSSGNITINAAQM